MAHEILSVKLCELENQLARLSSRIQLSEVAGHEELRQEHLAALKTQISKVYLLEYGEDKRTHIIEGNYFEV